MKKIITIAILCLAVLGGFAQSTNTYEYDNLNRLTKVYYANGAVTQYTYDALGNRLTKSVAGVSVSYTIAASVSPTNAGTVSGTGIYQGGSTCTLTASANAGYTFSNWTENGTLVSVAATYSFPVTSNRNLVANFTDANGNGLLSGVFSVSENTQVGFSQGNLQYQASTNTWRFAENQWDYIGTDNANASSTYSGWIDLFGWGTSGYNHGAVCYQPWSTSTTSADYYAYGNPSLNLSEGNGLADWGWNGISNGGQIVQSGWRTLSIDEWSYMLFTRPTPSGLRFAKANVEDVNGIILLPDDWSDSNYPLENVNDGEANYTDNSISGYEYGTDLESEGAVFLPVAGSRMGNSINFVEGVYWSATKCATHSAYLIYFNEEGMSNASGYSYYRYRGQSVRLVRTIEAATSYTIEATPNPVEGGTVAGAGIYEQGQTCTLTATFNEGYTFTAWTENGEVVSTEANFTFMVEGDRTLVANFAIIENIVFADPNVKAICVANWDTNGDGELSYAEAAAVTDIGNVFQYNYDIISFNELQYFTGLTYIGYYEFLDCINLTSVTIPNSVTSIDYGAFMQCSNLTSVGIIPNSVVLIGDYAFGNCGSLTSVVIPISVTSIGEYAFGYCSSLTGSLTIPNSVTSIGNSAFSGCSGLTSIEIPNSVTSIGVGTFAECSGLSQITVLPDNAMYDSRNNCNGIIETATNTLIAGCVNTLIPDDVVSIESWVFANLRTLTSIEIPNSVTTIGFAAFTGCKGLTSIEIPSSVISIGDHAFSFCDQLTAITIHAETPPTLESSSFVGVNPSIPVYVPCASVEAYQNAAWGGFSNFVGMCSYEVNATANPVAGGTVTGGGTFDAGILCTLTATPNAGYTFGSWTENGETVSTDATYSFTVSGDRTLVANFAPEGNYWTPENTGNYSLTMALTGVIEIDGVEQFSDQLEVGAFCNGVCRGSQMASEFYLTNRYLVMLSIHGEIGDELTFKLYDHGLAQELNLTSPNAVTFTIDGYGTPIEPYTLNFISSYEILATIDPEGAGTIVGTGSYVAGSSCTLVAEANDGYQFVNWTLDGVEVSTNATFDFTVTQSAAYVAHFHSVQTQTLAQGWNWWSTYIGQNGNDGLTMLENSLGSNGIRIQSKNNGYVDQFEYNGTSYWYGTLNALTNEQMYMVRTNTPCDATMTGQANVLADHPITINNGWNWIGFPGSESVSVANAMSGFAPEANDQIKSKNNGYSTYVSNALWYGTLNTLEPGQGYMYNSNSGETKTLVYQDGRGETRANVTTDGNMFQPNEADYAHNMTITAIVELGGDELRSDSYELAAFAGNECRGSVKLMYAELLDRYIAFLLVAGEAEENLRFVLTDGRNARWSDDEMKFTIDGVVGSPIEPAIIHFGTLGVEENEGDNIIVYPNPSKNVFNVEGEGLRKVEIVNAYGQLIFTKEIAGDYLQIDLGNRSAGVYMLRVVTEKGIKTQQIIKNN